MRWILALPLATLLVLHTTPSAAQFVPPVLLHQWGGGSGPLGIAADAARTVFVADQGGTVRAFTEDGALLRQWGTSGAADGQMNSAMDVAVGPDGNVYVADMGNNRIDVFSPAGVFLRKWGSAGSGDGQFSSPVSIDVAADGTVYVLDDQYNNHRVQVFAADGTFLRRWTVTPYAVRLALDGFGGVWIPDYVTGIVRKYSLTGGSLMYVGSSSPLNSPWCVDVDHAGRIFIGTVDPGIRVYSPAGDLLGEFARDYASDDLAFDADDNLVATTGLYVRVYSTQMATPARASTWGRLKTLYR